MLTSTTPPILRAKFGGNAGGINAQGFDVIGFDLRAEAGRAIVGKRNSVDHKLRLVFRSARMEHRIAFVEPAGLRIHQILQGAAGQRGRSILNGVRADLINGTGAIRINQRSRNR